MFKLNQALDAIKNKTEFSVKDRGDYIVIDYNLNSKTTFIGETDFESKILCNLRGTAFDKKSGDIIRLGYHKFFNYGEFPEVDKTLDFSNSHEIKRKLDGSCIFPIYVNDNIGSSSNYVLGTRAGVTDVSRMADTWVRSDEERFFTYWAFIESCQLNNKTPIFEYCSRENRVVLDYPESSLILTGIRSIENGSYASYEYLQCANEIFNIPIVECGIPTTNEKFSLLRQGVACLIEDEGVVIQFSNGHTIKIKADDYCLKHKALDSLKFEKDVLLLALDGLIDDVLPLLDDSTKNRVQNHVATFMAKFYETYKTILDEYSKVREIQDQKEFALEIAGSKYKSFMFSIRVGRIPFSELMRDYCKKQCSTQEKTRELKNFLSFDCVY